MQTRQSQQSVNNRPHRAPRKTALIIKVVLALTAVVAGVSSGAISAQAALVSGMLTTPGGHPASDRQIHFENRVTGVLYLVQTDSDGKFSTHLPPGVYDLRQEHGTIIRAGIGIDKADADLGKVAEPVGGFWFDPFELEELGERIIDSPAPSTANLPGANLPGGGAGTRPAAAPSSPSVAPR